MSAPCPHASLLEARRASHFPLRKGQSERPAEAHPGETEGAAPPARSGTQANPGLQEAHWLTCLCACLRSFSSTHSLNKQYPSTCAVPGPVLGAGVLALRVLMVLGEQTASNRSSHQWGRNDRRMCCSAPRQRQTTVPLDKVSQAASLPPHPMMCTEPCSDPIESPSPSLGQGLAEGL